jgi:hypothetical protein
MLNLTNIFNLKSKNAKGKTTIKNSKPLPSFMVRISEAKIFNSSFASFKNADFVSLF